MNNRIYTGIAADDRRIAQELQAMGAFDQGAEEVPSALSKKITAILEFTTWLRWKGEVAVYGCRTGINSTPLQKVSI